MSVELNPIRSESAAVDNKDGEDRDPADVSDYWDAFIPEKEAAAYLNLTPRALQGWRQKGGGPRYAALSSRCLRYTRRWLREHAVARVRTSTSDPGHGSA